MSFLKDTFIYSGATLSTQLLALVRGIGVRALVVPEILGLFNFIQVVKGFLVVFDFGANVGVGRELPLLSGRKAFDKGILIRSTLLWFTLFQSLFVAVIAIIYAWYNVENYTNSEINGFYIAASLLILGNLISCYDLYFRSAQLYHSLSKIMFIMSILELASYLIGVYYFGINGLLIAVTLTTLVRLVLFVIVGRRPNFSVIKYFSFKELKRMLRFGFPLRILDYPKQYMVMADLLWVTKFMDTKNLAIYSTARLFFSQIASISISLAVVFETRIIRQYGRDGSFILIKSIIKQFLYFQLLVVAPLTTCIGVVVVPFLLRQLMVNYLPSGNVFIILLMSSFFIVINSGLTLPWFIRKEVFLRGVSNLAGLLFIIISLVITWYIFERHDLTGIAISVTSGYFLYFTYMVIAVGKELWSFTESLKVLFLVLISFIYTGIVVFISNNFIENDLTFLNDIVQTLKIGSLTLLSILPLLLLGIKISDYINLSKTID